MIHASLLLVPEVFGFSSTTFTTLARRCLRQIVFEDDKHLPFVAIRIFHPGLVLQRVAATGLHFIARDEPRFTPLFAHREHVVGRRHLNSECDNAPRSLKLYSFSVRFNGGFCTSNFA